MFEVVVSTQSLLFKDGGVPALKERVWSRWDIEGFSRVASEYGVRVMYEPLRMFSKARRQLDERFRPTDRSSMRSIAMLAEPARSETEFPGFTKRLPYQLIYALFEEVRFSLPMINSLSDIEYVLSDANNISAFPTRVYSAKEGHHSAILDNRFRDKIAVIDLIKMMNDLVLSRKNLEDNNIGFLSASILSKIRELAVQGIEINLQHIQELSLKNNEFAVSLLQNLVSLKTKDGKPVLRAITVQTHRVDLGNSSIHRVNDVSYLLSIIRELDFQGKIIYAPGGGKMSEEIELLQNSLIKQSRNG